MPRKREEESENDEDEFDTGDGTAQTEATVVCPYCSEEVEITLDPGSGEIQDYVEDCEVCCKPWQVEVAYHTDGVAEVTLTPIDD
jgi:hypothetical protein